MARENKLWHPLFVQYMNFIINHPNYKGLKIQYKSDGTPVWLAPAKSDIGIQRKQWAENKAKQLGISISPGMYAKVMFEVHPTKQKVCQTCGKTMSLYYEYPNSSLLKSIKKTFSVEFDEVTSIYDIAYDLISSNDINVIKNFFVSKFSLSYSLRESDIDEILKQCELKCRLGEKKLLGPGAMSNFPDRFDGFHSYNRCCRSEQDKGRSKENLKSYTKDRRAYEFWSDGNIHAANQYMGSSFFNGHSADHMGPISLGFIHDPLFLRKMTVGENSTKRDRLIKEDIDKIIPVEHTHNVCAMSWYSSKIWNFVKENYLLNQDKLEQYRNALKTNMTTFMFTLWYLINENGDKGKAFLIDSFLKCKTEYFLFDYVFGEDGIIIEKHERNITDSTKKEVERFYRIAFEAVYDYNSKENRNIKTDLTPEEQSILENISLHLNKSEKSAETLKYMFIELIDKIQEKLINTLKS